MRMALSILKWVAIFIGLCLAAIAVLPQLPVLEDKLTAGPSKQYLTENAVELDYDRPDAGLAFPEEFYDHRLITLNEIHGYADVQRLDLAMMRHLHERTGWRVYLAELSPAQAMAFNDYVLGGSDLPARAVFDAWSKQTVQWGNREFFRKLTEIRRLNASLPDDERIVFIGVDLIMPADAAEWLEGRPAPLAAPDFASTPGIRAINHALLEDASSRRPATRYGEILANIERVLNVPGASHQRFYGLWGLYHGGQVSTLNGRPLALRLGGEGGLLEGEVATVPVLCLAGCFNLMPADAVPTPFRGPEGEAYSLIPMTFDNPYLARVRGAGELQERLGDSPAMLIPLRLDGSPYAKGSRLVEQTGFIAMLQPFPIDGAAAAAYDAMIVMQGSRALTPWRGAAFDVTRGNYEQHQDGL